MGKIKNNKRFSNRPSLQNLQLIDDEENFDDVWQKIAAQLQSSSSEERECGATSLSIIGRKKQVAEIIMDKKLIRIVAPLMLDSNISVQHSAVGALRNISLASEETCQKMVEQDVMTPLSKILTSYGEQEWNPHDENKSGDKIDSKTEIFIDAINLLWNLCEASDTALKNCQQNNLIPILMKHSSLENFGVKVVTSVLQCLYSISEDCQEPFNDFLPVLNGLKSSQGQNSQDLHMKLLTFGILLNLDKDEMIFSEVLHIITQILSQDSRNLVHEYAESLPKTEEEAQNNSMVKLQNELNHVILSQQTALEILANLCSSEDENWSETEEESDENEDEIIEENMETDLNTPTVIIEGIKSEKLVEKVLAKAILPQEKCLEILKEKGKKFEGEMVIQMVTTLQVKAFLCLNNLIECLTLEDLGGNEALFEVWKNLAQLSLFCEASNDVIEAATSAMRAATAKFKVQVSLEQLSKIAEFGATSSNVNVRVNIVNIMGTIGQNLVNKEVDESQILVAKFLIEAGSRDAELRVVIEALDKVIDMFSEDFTVKLGKEVNLVARLKGIQPGLKTKMGIFKQKNGAKNETMAMASMVKSNLGRFIKYKEKNK